MELKDTAVYYLEDFEGISGLSFVGNPATHVEWYKFNDESVSLDFQKDEMERMVTGPIMVAETPMWKPQLNGYVKFSAEQIKMMAKRTMIKKDFTFNEDHNPDKPIKGVHMIESFLINDKTQSKLYGNLPEGTWMGTFFIEDEDYWNNVIMTDKFKGFSLEGNFKPMLDEKIIEERFADIEMVLKSDLDDDTKYDSIKSLLMDFACPPKGDGKRKDGEPDKRCGDGTKKASGGGAKAPAKTEAPKPQPKKPSESFDPQSRDALIDNIMNGETVKINGDIYSKPVELSEAKMKTIENNILNQRRPLAGVEGAGSKMFVSEKKSDGSTVIYETARSSRDSLVIKGQQIAVIKDNEISFKRPISKPGLKRVQEGGIWKNKPTQVPAFSGDRDRIISLIK